MSDPFLDAFADLSASLDQGAQVVLQLDVDLIDPDPEQPRDTFDEADEAALAATIREKGVLQPITVRPQEGNGRYFIRFGERRWRAAKLAGLRAIPALLHKGADSAADRLYEQVIENDQRAGLSTAQMARAVERLLAMGETQAAIGRRLGRPKDQITMLAAVRTMAAPVKALAPQLGVRALYEINQAWKTDAPAVEHWLKDRDPATITQAAARQLSARVAESDRDAVIEGRAPAKPGAPRKPPPAALALKPSAGAAVLGEVVIEVLVQGRAGRLELRAAEGDGAYVQFKDRGRTRSELIPLAQITLTGLRRIRP